MKLALLLVLAACTVDRKTDSLKCALAADCAQDNHVCENGYCVKASQSDCPDHCSACDTAAKTCTVVDTGGNDFTCPNGYTCVLQCGSGSNSKCGEITCQSNSQCVISCEGSGNCGDIHCDNACACDVTCTDSGCTNNDIHCPHDGNMYCTPDQTDGPACTSMAGGRCNSC